MLKKLLLALMVIVILFISGCKGTRYVRVKVIHSDQWSATIVEASTAMTKTAKTTKVYDLGDSKENIVVTAYKSNTGTAQITLQILEDFDNGFLYTDTSTVIEEESTTDVGGAVQVSHDFSPKN